MTQTRTLTLAGARGDGLKARLDLPDGKPRGAVLVAHCFGGGNAGPAAAQVARSFSELGMAVLSLDVAQAGHTGDESARAAFSLDSDDLVTAADQLRDTIAAPSILVGHSLGGAAVLAIAAQVPEARALAALATRADAAQGAEVGRISVQALRPRIATLGRALLVIHSPDDEVAEIGHARVIFEAARHPKSFVSLDGADHRLTRPADAAYTANVMAAWAARYLPARRSPDGGTPPAGSARREVVVVTESEARPFGQRITVGGHELTADISWPDVILWLEPGHIALKQYPEGEGTGRVEFYDYGDDSLFVFTNRLLWLLANRSVVLEDSFYMDTYMMPVERQEIISRSFPLMRPQREYRTIRRPNIESSGGGS